MTYTKRALAAVVAAVLMLSMLAGCGMFGETDDNSSAYTVTDMTGEMLEDLIRKEPFSGSMMQENALLAAQTKALARSYISRIDLGEVSAEDVENAAGNELYELLISKSLTSIMQTECGAAIYTKDVAREEMLEDLANQISNGWMALYGNYYCTGVCIIYIESKDDPSVAGWFATWEYENIFGI